MEAFGLESCMICPITDQRSFSHSRHESDSAVRHSSASDLDQSSSGRSSSGDSPVGHISSPLQHAEFPDSPTSEPASTQTPPHMSSNSNQGASAPIEPLPISTTMPVGYHETPVSSGSGISVMLALAEPMLFLEGFDRGDSSSRKTSLLRGYLRIKVAKAAKIKKIYLHFKGTSHTHWPEGVPPRKQSTVDAISLMNHTWTFFNAQFAHAEHSYCADRVNLQGPVPASEGNRPVLEELFHTKAMESTIAPNATSQEIKRKTLQPGGRPRSISKGEGVAN
ncbi:arrestin domain-containing protein [Ascosphaera apis ARSEF 7405]|uniref:Arrestin domain-containing protein n=1 Tax=Ascosphaera apis ARSEF 7405 TaxID=392613 RepID=A0A167WC52_9EURO|nr:arrestin domain-containing protein [Ascosphaera apis ARSEF 7405]